VWGLVEGRAGDDAQVRELAASLGWPVRLVELRDNGNVALVLDRVMDLLGLERPPVRLPKDLPANGPRDFPDVVLAIAGRSVSTARRIVRASGGRTRLVHLGRPFARLARFDLLITTPQYGLPERDNVLVTPLPFCRRRDPADMPRAGTASFVDLPRPWTALLVGGDSSSHKIGAPSVDRILAAARAACAEGGSVLATTSPRTSPSTCEALSRGLPESSSFYRFQPNDPENPYPAILAMADRFLVTGESASLIAEATSTGRPVDIVPVDERWYSRALVAIHRALRATPLRSAIDALTANALWIPPRDLAAVHDAVAAASAAGQSTTDPERVLARIHSAVGGPR